MEMINWHTFDRVWARVIECHCCMPGMRIEEPNWMFSTLQRCHDRRLSLSIHRRVTIACSGMTSKQINLICGRQTMKCGCNLPANCHCAIRDASVCHWLCTRQHCPYRSWRQWSLRVTLKWFLAKWSLAVPQVNATNHRMLCESIQDRLE